MWLEQTNQWVRTIRATDDERSWIETLLRGQSSRFRKGANLYDMILERFPSGVLPLVRQEAKEEGITIEVMDRRVQPCLARSDAVLGWLRQDQRDAVARAVHMRRGILWCPTAFGKTEVAIGLVATLPCRWLFLVHRANLMTQTAARYELRFPGQIAGRFGDAHRTVARFTCATFQTLLANAQDPTVQALLADTQGVIFDEVHTLGAAEYWRLAMSLPNAFYRVGLSGTPLARGDDRNLLVVAATGPVIYHKEAAPLIAEGSVSKPMIKLVRVSQITNAVSWPEIYKACVVQSARRNAVVTEIAMRAEKPCFVFVKDIQHGETLTAMLRARGVRAEFVYGEMDNADRARALDKLRSGILEVVVCSVVFQEGVDVPTLRSVVNAAGGKSIIAALQRVGRGMRKSPGKATFEVWDLDDVGVPYLSEHSVLRKQTYLRAQYATAMVPWLMQEAG
jgi:superfamily II DNA or RNA helicase